ncbi:hypothetical protein [Streptomyces sp. NPDC051554]|uniref:hypothetical protein n=1 Tax=Streptomyces sp. NPDC051554 TaxID=3365656 RepID=UPI0037B8ACAD
MAGQVGEGVEKLGEGVRCSGRAGGVESLERVEGVDSLGFQVVVGVAESGGVGVVGGAVLSLLQEVVPAAGEVVQQEVQPLLFALAFGGVAVLGAFEGSGQQIGSVRVEHVLGVEGGQRIQQDVFADVRGLGVAGGVAQQVGDGGFAPCAAGSCGAAGRDGWGTGGRVGVEAVGDGGVAEPVVVAPVRDLRDGVGAGAVRLQAGLRLSLVGLDRVGVPVAPGCVSLGGCRCSSLRVRAGTVLPRRFRGR